MSVYATCVSTRKNGNTRMAEPERVTMSPEMMAKFCHEHLSRAERTEIVAAEKRVESFLALLTAGPQQFRNEREVALNMLRVARQVNSGGLS